MNKGERWSLIVFISLLIIAALTAHASAYTGTIPNKPIVTGTIVPTITQNEYDNLTWEETGNFLIDIKNSLIPVLFTNVADFVPYLIIIIGFGALVVLVEGWIRLMR